MPRFVFLTLCSLSIAALLLTAAAPPAGFDDGPFESGEFRADAVHSSAVFSVLHLGIARFYGRFNGISGGFQLDLEHPERSSVTLEIDAASVDTHSEGRDRHIRSDDFLAAETHPTLSFRSTSVKRVADDRLEVTGELTLRGVTRPLRTEVELVGAGETFFGDFRTGVEARFGVDRTEFGIDGVPGGVGNEIDFVISLEAIRVEDDAPGESTER